MADIKIQVPDGDVCENCKYLTPYYSSQIEGQLPQCKMYNINLGYTLRTKDAGGVITYKCLECYKNCYG